MTYTNIKTEYVSDNTLMPLIIPDTSIRLRLLLPKPKLRKDPLCIQPDISYKRPHSIRIPQNFP